MFVRFGVCLFVIVVFRLGVRELGEFYVFIVVDLRELRGRVG